MSFPKNDRNIQSKNGKTFPKENETAHLLFIPAIALALRSEFGGGPSAVKTVARLTETNERAVRNWFDAKNGPNGENLITLMQHSDVVLGTVLDLSSRPKLRVTVDLANLRIHLANLMMAIDNIPAPPP
ncbi:hypothetical protein [Asticcacaulis sp. 201]|uniref:hypothetical protein n=1 Tax=Asticcacaulis sp. 201 TaxID=3028787 RepID=UPI0029169AD5|nr:hypothetical protein [Asticcacaulis sp. 201]MDV6333162.1 hypothetical protein [Asticcacaulis sp. 201]